MEHHSLKNEAMSHPIGWILLEIAMALLAFANIASFVAGGGNRILEVGLTVGAVAIGLSAEIQRRRAKRDAPPTRTLPCP